MGRRERDDITPSQKQRHTGPNIYLASFFCFYRFCYSDHGVCQRILTFFYNSCNYPTIDVVLRFSNQYSLRWSFYGYSISDWSTIKRW